jgi:hypothetical protein
MDAVHCVDDDGRAACAPPPPADIILQLFNNIISKYNMTEKGTQ